VRRATVLLLLLLAVGCGSEDRGLPFGSYAGSTAAHQALTVDVAGSSVHINSHRTERGPDKGWIERTAPHTRVKCHPTPHRELRCLVTVAGHTETVDLMRL
jgi:hypothetical protein